MEVERTVLSNIDNIGSKLRVNNIDRSLKSVGKKHKGFIESFDDDTFDKSSSGSMHDNASNSTVTSKDETKHKKNDIKFGVDRKRFSNKEILYYQYVNKYFRKHCSKENINLMISIINGESKISLRKLDWFITHYAKKHRKETTYDVEGESFPVHISYKAQLYTFKKRNFDPFRRRKKLYYNYDKSDKKKYIETTIGQLNFFHWAFSNDIILYFGNNYDAITESMIKEKKDKKGCVTKQTKKATNDTESKDSSDDSVKSLRQTHHKKRKYEKKPLKTKKVKEGSSGMTATIKEKKIKGKRVDLIIDFNSL
jgi:hypothetical protein